MVHIANSTRFENDVSILAKYLFRVCIGTLKKFHADIMFCGHQVHFGRKWIMKRNLSISMSVKPDSSVKLSVTPDKMRLFATTCHNVGLSDKFDNNIGLHIRNMFLKVRVIDAQYIVKISRGVVKHVYEFRTSLGTSILLRTVSICEC